MLLTRSLPPQFLLPAWSSQQLAQAVQRAHKSSHDKPSPQATTLALKPSSYSGSGTKKYTIRSETTPEDADSSSGARRKGGSRSLQLGQREETHPEEAHHEAKPMSQDRDTIRGLQHQLRQQMKQLARQEAQLAQAKMAETKMVEEKSTEPLSLFEELFPEEALAQEKQRKRAMDRLDKLPAFQWHGQYGVEDSREKERAKRKETFKSIPARQKSSKVIPPSRQTTRSSAAWPSGPPQGTRVSVLVLSACSKTLEETDFYRVGPQGNHVEGWTSGVLKVIPARDNNTLQPFGQYYLLFSSGAAARAYLDQTIRLHHLSRKSSGGSGIFPSQPQTGEDAMLQNFSLVPPTGKLSLKMVERPYSPGLAWMIEAGGPAALVARQSKARDIVLLSTDRGYVNPGALAEALRLDGKRRNLHWKLAGTRNEAIVKLESNNRAEKHLEEFADDVDEDTQRRRNRYRGPARYTIAFKDSNEARRFVREWHMRPFPRLREDTADDDTSPIVTAEVLW